MSTAMKKWSIAMAVCIAPAIIGGCVTSTISHHVAADGHDAEQIVFPEAGDAHPKSGTFPSVDSLRKIGPGMTKAQVQTLIGPPHFKEGIWGVREWDYLFNFRDNHQLAVCQYKILFDKNKAVGSVHWLPSTCASLFEQAKPVAADTSVLTPSKVPMRVSADVLFDLGRADLTPKGREILAGLQQQLRLASGTQDIHVVGYTDRIGSDASNLILSRQRAEAVRKFLLANGVVPATVLAEGRGNADPIVECADSERRDELVACLAPNRRVELSGIASP